MSIRYECEQCGSVLKIKDDLSGKPGKCPKCKTAFTVPAPANEADSSDEIAAASDSPEDAEPMLAETKSAGASADFDLDAFLLDGDDAPKPKVAKTSQSAKELEEDDSSLDEPVKKSDRKSPKTDEDGEGFSIRRGPDAPDKQPKQPRMPGLEGDEPDEQPAPSRRPPGTNPNAPASNIASDLLSKSAKKGKKTAWNEVEPEKRDEEKFDWAGLRREVLTKFLPGIVGIVVVYWLLSTLVGSAMGSKTFVPPLGQVTGTLTVNAKPLVGAEVWFYPETKKIEKDGKTHRVTASTGTTDAAGHYELTYIGDLKGAVIGTCRIQIIAAGRRDIAHQYQDVNGKPSTATQTIKKGKQVIDLELSQ